jgi:glycerophosphoryl diester phosphodiesterase
MRRIITVFIAFLLCAGAGAEDTVRGYIRDVPPESPAAREARHMAVAERRKGPMMVVHRGAWAFAPENTLEAFAAAVDYGADGVELDLRRTADGVLVCFHDTWVNRMTDGWGTVAEHTYYQLLEQEFRRYGTATADTHIPTFAAVLVLARQRAMLLNLDIKDSGIEQDIALMIDDADMWDHVVGVSEWNTETIPKRPEYSPVPSDFLPDGRRDMDPAAVRKVLSDGWKSIMVDDPRIAARELKRAAYRPVPLPKGLHEDWPPSTAPHDPNEFAPSAYVRSLITKINPESEGQLLSLLSTRRMERIQVDGSEEYQRLQTERILARAWAAQHLGKLGRKSSLLVELLEYQVENRSLHRDLRYHGMDGAYAAKALAELGAVESVPVLLEVFNRNDPELDRMAGPDMPAPLDWVDFGLRVDIVTALGELRCKAAKEFLADYLELGEEEAKKMGRPMYEEAAVSMMGQDLSVEEIKALLQHARPEVRGMALWICLDRPTKERTAALEAVAPWALDLPRAKR